MSETSRIGGVRPAGGGSSAAVVGRQKQRHNEREGQSKKEQQAAGEEGGDVADSEGREPMHGDDSSGVAAELSYESRLRQSAEQNSNSPRETVNRPRKNNSFGSLYAEQNILETKSLASSKNTEQGEKPKPAGAGEGIGVGAGKGGLIDERC
ncbi:MAG: hypothetical protein AAF098_07840 [Pseudomonadota bacterium]